MLQTSSRTQTNRIMTALHRKTAAKAHQKRNAAKKINRYSKQSINPVFHPFED